MENTLGPREMLSVLAAFSGQSQTLSTQLVYLSIAGDYTAAHFLSEVISMSCQSETGWFYRTDEEWTRLLHISPKQRRRVTAALIELGLVETKLSREGGGPTLHYRILGEALCQKVSEHIAGNPASKQIMPFGNYPNASDSENPQPVSLLPEVTIETQVTPENEKSPSTPPSPSSFPPTTPHITPTPAFDSPCQGKNLLVERHYGSLKKTDQLAVGFEDESQNQLLEGQRQSPRPGTNGLVVKGPGGDWLALQCAPVEVDVLEELQRRDYARFVGGTISAAPEIAKPVSNKPPKGWLAARLKVFTEAQAVNGEHGLNKIDYSRATKRLKELFDAEVLGEEIDETCRLLAQIKERGVNWAQLWTVETVQKCISRYRRGELQHEGESPAERTLRTGMAMVEKMRRESDVIDIVGAKEDGDNESSSADVDNLPESLSQDSDTELSGDGGSVDGISDGLDTGIDCGSHGEPDCDSQLSDPAEHSGVEECGLGEPWGADCPDEGVRSGGEECGVKRSGLSLWPQAGFDVLARIEELRGLAGIG